jgi:hypothetical protein
MTCDLLTPQHNWLVSSSFETTPYQQSELQCPLCLIWLCKSLLHFNLDPLFAVLHIYSKLGGEADDSTLQVLHLQSLFFTPLLESLTRLLLLLSSLLEKHFSLLHHCLYFDPLWCILKQFFQFRPVLLRVVTWVSCDREGLDLFVNEFEATLINSCKICVYFVLQAFQILIGR